jgi:hypothetical protein
MQIEAARQRRAQRNKPGTEKGTDMTRLMPAFFAAAVVALGCAAALAQENRGTPEQRAACTPDAFRLCGAYIPDPTGVEACLRLRKSDLSEACKAVFDRTTTGSAKSR